MSNKLLAIPLPLLVAENRLVFRIFNAPQKSRISLVRSDLFAEPITIVIYLFSLIGSLPGCIFACGYNRK